MTQSAASRLPNEVLQRIFWYAALSTDSPLDYIDFWADARKVSRTWKANVEQAYFDVLVKNRDRRIIYCDCGEAWVPDMETGSIHHFVLELRFDRLEEGSEGPDGNKTRVVFSEAITTKLVPRGWSQEWKSSHKLKKLRAWKEKIETYLGTDKYGDEEGGGCFDDTPHVICLNGMVNDTELPGLKFDVDKQEMSFEWLGMLVKFSAEQVEVSRRSAIDGQRSRKKFNKLTHQTAAKEREYKAALLVKMQKNEKEVRRKRIYNHYLAKDDFWKDKEFPFNDEEEAEILEKMRKFIGHGAHDDPGPDTPDYPTTNLDDVDYRTAGDINDSDSEFGFGSLGSDDEDEEEDEDEWEDSDGE